uniref:G-protein coupled receptors family 1 profile domain-containing protein n=1 Tax=Astyanax mexicanus TaxID=7994 RepID=A0A3B1KDV1_ASTMX
MENLSFVRPEYFYISGFTGIPFINYYFIFLIFTYIIAVFGNSFVAVIILTDRSLHVPKYLGIFNLALADIGETNALIPALIKTFFVDSQYISYDACLVNMFFVFFFSSVQALTLVVLAYDRFIAICLPLRYHAIVNNYFMSVVLIGVWSVCSAFNGTTVALITRLSFCKSNVVKSYFFMAKLCSTLFIYIPLIFIVLSYLGIFLALSKITTWAGRLKALKTCVSHLLAVGVFFLPIIITYFATYVSMSLSPNARIINTSLSNAIPSMLNPVIYVLNTKEFKYFKFLK